MVAGEGFEPSKAEPAGFTVPAPKVRQIADLPS